MGGLVVKKAYILAHQDPALSPLARRIQSICFLAVPHRRPDVGRFLSEFCDITGSSCSRRDWSRNSTIIHAINEEFILHANQLFAIYSFWEMLPTLFGSPETIPPDRDPSTLGLDNEISCPLNADHRGICQFKSIKDLNYQAIRHALVTIIAVSNEITHEEMVKSLGWTTLRDSDCLSVSERPGM